MANDTAYKSKQNIYAGANGFNSIKSVIDSAMSEISTAIPVKVVNVIAGSGASGYVDVLPLVGFIDGNGEMVQPVSLYHLPYFRTMGGICGIVCDPVAGDKGLAIFAQADSSTITSATTTPQPPGSYRKHSQSDGFYVGGFFNTSPSCFIELNQAGQIVITAPGGVTINGDITTNGGMTTTGDVVAGSISLQGHTHPGVESGGSSTGTPQ